MNAQSVKEGVTIYFHFDHTKAVMFSYCCIIYFTKRNLNILCDISYLVPTGLIKTVLFDCKMLLTVIHDRFEKNMYVQTIMPVYILSSYDSNYFIHIFFSLFSRKHKISFSRNLKLTGKSVL